MVRFWKGWLYDFLAPPNDGIAADHTGAQANQVEGPRCLLWPRCQSWHSVWLTFVRRKNCSIGYRMELNLWLKEFKYWFSSLSSIITDVSLSKSPEKGLGRPFLYDLFLLLLWYALSDSAAFLEAALQTSLGQCQEQAPSSQHERWRFGQRLKDFSTISSQWLASCINNQSTGIVSTRF